MYSPVSPFSNVWPYTYTHTRHTHTIHSHTQITHTYLCPTYTSHTYHTPTPMHTTHTLTYICTLTCTPHPLSHKQACTLHTHSCKYTHIKISHTESQIQCSAIYIPLKSACLVSCVLYFCHDVPATVRVCFSTRSESAELRGMDSNLWNKT